MFEQYLFTDNKQGGGLSVLNQSPGIPKTLLNRLGGYASYEAPLTASKETTPEAFKDAYRYNYSFAKAPLLMNTAYIGKEITTGRNRNFAVHTFISDEPLKNYAIDYFSEEKQLFRRSFKMEEVDGSNTDFAPLPRLHDDEIFSSASLTNTVNLINSDIEAFSNILQATILASQKNVWVKMMNYSDPTEILKMLYYVLPVNIANQISFNTRAYSEEKLISSDIEFEVNGKPETRTCVFGSVELIQFYDNMWSKSGGEATYTFYGEGNNFSFNMHFPFIEWLKDKGGITVDKIDTFKELILVKGYEKLSDLPSIKYDELVAFAIERKKPEYKTVADEPVVPEVKEEQPIEFNEAPSGKVNKNSDTVPFEKPKKKRRIKLSIANIMAACLVLTIGIIGVSNLVKKGGGGVIGEKQYFVLNNEEIAVSDWAPIIPPDKDGYDFNGYVDEDGAIVINADGSINPDYQLDTKGNIVLSENWMPKDNRITIVCQNNNISFVCKTDESIVVSQEDMDALINSSKLHMEFQGLALSESGELIYQKSFDGVYRFNSPYGTMSSVAYGEGIKNSEIKLYPVYAPQTMVFNFTDYYTKQPIATESIVYSEQGNVPLESFLSKYPEYSDCNIYIQTENSDDLLEIYTKDGKWNGQQGKLSSEKYYSGNVTLYISRRVTVFWGSTTAGESVNFGDDLQTLASAKLAENSHSTFKFSNAIYYAVGNSKEYFFTDNAATVLAEIGSETRVSVYPAYRVVYRFHVFDVGSMKYVQLSNISAETRIKLTLSTQEPTIEYIGYAANSTPIQRLIYNDFEIATAENQRWVTSIQAADYSKINGCLFYSVFDQDGLGFLIEGSKINKGIGLGYLADNNATNNTVDLYGAYNPSDVPVKFSSAGNKYIAFGSTFMVPQYPTANWGYEYVSWKSDAKKLSPNQKVTVDFNFLSNVKKSSGVLFEAEAQAYKFGITFSFDGKKHRYEVDTEATITVGDGWSIDKTSAKDYYTNNYLNKAYKYIRSEWTDDWYIKGTDIKFNISQGSIVISEDVLGKYVTFNSVKETIELELEKKIVSRKYKIVFNTVPLLVSDSGSTNTQTLTNTNYTPNTDVIIFEFGQMGSITINPYDNEVRDNFGSSYLFVCWELHGGKWTDKDGKITINEELLELWYKNCTKSDDGTVEVTVTPIFEKKKGVWGND